MPSKSKSQQRFFGLVRAYQKGDVKPGDVGKSVKDAAKSMTKKDVEDFAATKHKGLPNHVKKNKRKKSKNENRMRVINITEDQYNEIVSLLEDKNAANQISIGLTNPTESDENPNNLSRTIQKTEVASRAAGIQPSKANIEAEVNVNGKEKEITVKGENNESVIISKRQVDEMRIHNRNRKSKVLKVKDFLR